MHNYTLETCIFLLTSVTTINSVIFLKKNSVRPNSIRKSYIRIMDIPEREEREKGTENLFKQIMDKNFPKHLERTGSSIQ